MKSILAALLWVLSVASVWAQPRAGMELDHLLIFVQDDAIATKLMEAGFNHAEKMETEHTNQGTVGRFFIFQNTYIELLRLENKEVVVGNAENFGSNYLDRWLGDQCQWGFGLKINPFDLNNLPFPHHQYTPDASKPEGFYIMSRANTDLRQPMVYASPPEFTYPGFESDQAVDEAIEDPAVTLDFKNYLAHSNGARKVTAIRFEVPAKAGLDRGNLAILSQLPELEVIPADRYHLTLVLDDGQSGKSIDFGEEVGMVIRY